MAAAEKALATRHHLNRLACDRKWRRKPLESLKKDSEMAPSPQSPPAQTPDRRRRRGERRALDQARAPVEPQRPPDVGSVGVAPPLPHECVVGERLAVDARPGELEAERAGHRRLRPAGVGRAMMRGVEPYG